MDEVPNSFCNQHGLIWLKCLIPCADSMYEKPYPICGRHGQMYIVSNPICGQLRHMDEIPNPICGQHGLRWMTYLIQFEGSMDSDT